MKQINPIRKLHRLTLLLALGLAFPWIPAGAQVSLTGTVIDSVTATPISGVSVSLGDSAGATSTDAQGRFTLDAQPGATVVFRHVGYEEHTINVNENRTLTIRLRPLEQALEEVVVVGYGSQRRADITSAISVVNMEQVGDVPTTNTSRLLQGQAAGVQVRQRSGRPGEEMEITIRGLGSLGAGSQPLFVVDGFPIGTSLGQNLNPADIESITILKDAASTAIYGARGSNGVILVTTKSAQSGKVGIDFVINQGVANIPGSRRTKMMNGVEFARFKKESFEDRIRYFEQREPTLEEIPEEFRYPEQTQYSTDWFGEIMNQNAMFQNYNATLTAGKGDIRSLVSVGYINQEGAVIKTDFDRFNARANTEGKVTDWLSMGWNIAGSRSRENYAPTDGRDALVGRALWADPRYPVYNEDGSFNAYIGGTNGVFGTANVVQEMHEMERILNTNNILTNGYLEFSFLKDFKFKTSVNATLIEVEQKEYRPSTLAGAGSNQPPPREASLMQRADKVLNVAADQLLSYNKTVAQHRFEALLGYTAQEETFKRLQGNGNDFPNDVNRYLNSAVLQTSSSGEYSWSLLAYFVRANYSFDDKYLFSASFRREGSSRFGSNSKWGNFPAVSAAWRVSEESFMPQTDWITDLKLRASYGITGNNAIGNYSSLANMAISNYVFGGNIADGQRLFNFANANLGWEQSEQTDIGLDLALFGSRLIFTAEYYNRLTRDMLLSVEMPIVSGFGSSLDNVGKVRNRGVELAVDYRTELGQLNLRGNLNFTLNRNKVLEIRGENDEIWNGGLYSTYNVSKIGRPMAMLYGFRMMGIFNTEDEIGAWPEQDGAIPGTYKFYDANGDGVISYDQQDMIEIGNPHPDYVINLTLGGDYKRVDFNVLFTGAFNYDVFRNIEATTMNMDGVFNVLQSAANRWRSAENPGDGTGATTNTWKWQRESNSRYVYDASHVWLRNISFGYTIPQNPVIPNARVFFSAENLFLFTAFPGSNPEVNQREGINIGVDDEKYPVPRTFTLGASIKF
ncbi:SusC/RagA family TonB-linked outer membrane protein [Parapedobacter sp. DT-150]|uniref:SusC/RagA family TonB-linked outer membrane protein n=1 Tax=Parapedobacter sp. DT-150 TaxID=3396162 RepID=UPI003F19A739